MSDRIESQARPRYVACAATAPPGSGPRPSGLRSGLLAAVLLGLVAACAGPRSARGNRLYEPPTSLAAHTLFATGTLPPGEELRYLQTAATAPALLRRAWLELEAGRVQDALDSSSMVLFTTTPPSPQEEAAARYVRAEAFRRQGQPERAGFDLERARALAMDPGLQARLGSPQTAAAQPTSTPWGDLQVLPRATWGAHRPDRSNLDPMQRPARVTIHHSATYFRDTSARAAAAQIARIQRQHMSQREFGDIGYHFLIDPSGRIWEGRPLRFQGAHASGDNNIANIGICLLGNFVHQHNGQLPSRLQVTAMERLVVNLMHHYRFDAEALFCHSDFKNTACPGPRMRPLVRQFARQLVAQNGGAVSNGRAEDE